MTASSWSSDDSDGVVSGDNETGGIEASAPSLPSGPTGRNEQLARVEVAVLATILAMALLGNGLVASVLRRLRSRQKLTRMNTMIAHLIVADTAVALFNVLPQMAWKLTFRFRGGSILCKTVAYGQLVAMFAAAYVLVATAVDRYLAICHPLQTQIWNGRRMSILVMIVWCVSLAFATPQLFLFAYQPIDKSSPIFDCICEFPSDWALTAYITWAAVAIYFIPLLTLIGAYYCICLAVWRSDGFKRQALATPSMANRSKSSVEASGAKIEKNAVDKRRRAGEDGGAERTLATRSVSWRDEIADVSNSRRKSTSCCFDRTDADSDDIPVTPLRQSRHIPRQTTLSSDGRENGADVDAEELQPASAPPPNGCRVQKQRVSSAKLRTVKLTLIVVASYLTCYGPYFVSQLWASWDTNFPYEDTPMVLISLLASLNSCVNPWIYLAFNDQVFRQLLAAVCYCPCRRRPTVTRRSTNRSSAGTSPHLDVHRCQDSTRASSRLSTTSSVSSMTSSSYPFSCCCCFSHSSCSSTSRRSNLSTSVTNASTILTTGNTKRCSSRTGGRPAVIWNGLESAAAPTGVTSGNDGSDFDGRRRVDVSRHGDDELIVFDHRQPHNISIRIIDYSEGGNSPMMALTPLSSRCSSTELHVMSHTYS